MNVDYVTAQGFAGTKGMKPEAAAFWEDVLARMAKDPERQKLLERNLWANAYMNSEEMSRYYQSEFVKL